MNPTKSFKVVITDVLKGGQAETMGLKAGDTLVSYNGQPITSTDQFARLFDDARGDVFPLEVDRGDAKLTFKVKPGKLGISFDNRPLPPDKGAEPAK